MTEELLGSAPVGWKYASLGEIQEFKGIQGGPFGSQLHARDYVPAGIPLIMPKNIGVNRLLDTGHDFVAREDAERLASHRVKIGDIVVGRKGDLSRRALIREHEQGWLCGTDCIRIRVERAVISTRYLSYYLGIKAVTDWLHRHDTGSTMPNLNTTNLGRLPVLMAPRRYQTAVAEILRSLDDKIENNVSIFRTARELARAHFRAAVESADRYEVELSSVAGFISRGVTPRYSEDESQLRVLNQKCIRGGRVDVAPSRRTLAARVPDVKLLRMNDVLVNSTGVGTLGRLTRWTIRGAYTVDSHITIVRFDSAKVDPVCAGFAMLDCEPQIEALGEGSTGQTELSRSQLATFRITVPARERAAHVRSVLDALEARGDSACEESITLAELRDCLMPELMSGKIRVRDAEKVAEEVT